MKSSACEAKPKNYEVCSSSLHTCHCVHYIPPITSPRKPVLRCMLAGIAHKHVLSLELQEQQLNDIEKLKETIHELEGKLRRATEGICSLCFFLLALYPFYFFFSAGDSIEDRAWAYSIRWLQSKFGKCPLYMSGVAPKMCIIRHFSGNSRDADKWKQHAKKGKRSFQNKARGSCRHTDFSMNEIVLYNKRATSVESRWNGNNLSGYQKLNVHCARQNV